jgi:hypothetical protein
VASLEQLIQTQKLGHRTTLRSSEGAHIGGRTVCTKAVAAAVPFQPVKA